MILQLYKIVREKGGATLIAALLVFVCTAFNGAIASADWRVLTCQEFVGTYLITNFDEEGSVDSRSLITFWADGNFFFLDSNQGGVDDVFNPFTDAAGSWTCSRKGFKQNVANVVALDFTLPGTVDSPQEIARLDFFDVTVNPISGKIQGLGKLRFFPLEFNPLHPSDVIVDPFHFEGERITAKPMRKAKWHF